MGPERLFELCNRLRNVALTQENLSKIIVRLGQFRVQFSRLFKMASSFRQLSFAQKQGTQIDVSVDVSRIQLQSLSVFCNCLFWLSVFFQECTVTVMRLRRFWRETNRSLRLRSRLFLSAELIQKISIAGMIFGVLRFDASCLLKVALGVAELALGRQQ